MWRAPLATFDFQTKTISARHAPYFKFFQTPDPVITPVRSDSVIVPPREVKLGTFKLSGLKDVQVEEEHFQPLDVFEPAAEKYAGETLLAIEA